MPKKKEKRVQSLTIYLVKPEFTKLDQIASAKANDAAQFQIDIPGCNGVLYVRPRSGIKPKWVPLFSEFVKAKDIGTVSTLSAALIVNTAGRFFVLAFGNGRHLIGTDVVEERFGLLVVLNSVERNSIRVVDKQSLDAIQSHARIQSGQATTADQFGLDVEQDMLKGIVGMPKTAELGTRMAGADSLSVAARMDLSDLPALLKQYKERFDADLHPDYEWVNNIKQIKKQAALREELELELIAQLNSKQHDRIWLAIPEVIDWTMVVGFMFTHGKGWRYPDINLQGFLQSIKEDQKITIDMLHSRDVTCVDEDDEPTKQKWSIYRCIYAEIDHHGCKYILNGGAWFEVGSDFVAITNKRFAGAAYSDLRLPEYDGGDERAYNEKVAIAHPDTFALLDDKKKIFHGGSKGQVEACDLLSSKKQLIHIKRYYKSSVLSHLFAQGFVSGQLMQIDSEFRQKVKDKLTGAFADLINPDKRPEHHEFSVIFAVISDAEGEKLNLPFFSRVNFNNNAKILSGLGYKVELLKIEWSALAKAVHGAAAAATKLA